MKSKGLLDTVIGQYPGLTPRFFPFSAWAGHLPFGIWIVEALRPRVILELGVFAGASYCAFCQAVDELQLASACFGVDTWEGDEHAGYYEASLLDNLKAYHDPLYGSFSRLVRSTFDEASTHFELGSIDLLHIDGYHTYEAVRHDFETWSDKLSERSLVLFHDVNVREGDFGVWRFWNEVSKSRPHFTFLHGHGLGVLGVGRDLPSRISALFGLAEQDAAEIRRHFEYLGHPYSKSSQYISDERNALNKSIGRYHTALTEANKAREADREELSRYHVALTEANKGREADREELKHYHVVLSRAKEGFDAEMANWVKKLEEMKSVVNEASSAASRFSARFYFLRNSLIEERQKVAAHFASFTRKPMLTRKYALQFILSNIKSWLRSKPETVYNSHCVHFQSFLLREVFDEMWYAGSYPDVAMTEMSAWEHFLQEGLDNGRSPNAFFDPDWYLEQNPDVKDANENALLHYLFFGALEGRDPSPHFDSAFYVEAHPEAVVNPLAHYLKKGRHKGFATSQVDTQQKPSPSHNAGCLQDDLMFLRPYLDCSWYLGENQDVMEAGFDPWIHFIEHGLYEGRAPNSFFDPKWYLEHYPDVEKSGQPALLHFARHGAAEGRDPSGEFHAAFYVQEHPEAAENPLLYHLAVGRDKGWRTSRPLDVSAHITSKNAAFKCPAVRVSIIIPAFRGLSETQRCLAAVLADRLRPPGDILVIDDCSPEPDLSAFLAGLSCAGKIRLLRNTENIGFVASVNLGMEAVGSDDVVLLNSDTQVPEGWASRLAAQAYSALDVGTVTPFSNNATICSYPSLPGGALPSGRSVEAIDNAFAKANVGRNVDLPSAVGFAMYIRRDCLDAVGQFDVATFGLGYGEENDFSLRATAKGWRHLLACDTFVFHEGEVSFGKQSPKRENAWNVLIGRYPDYPRLVAKHINLDAAGPYRFAATLALIGGSKRPIILVITHDLGGGTERHVNELIEKTREKAEHIVLRPIRSGVSLTVPSVAGLTPLHLTNEQSEELLSILRDVGIKRVHIHHLISFKMDIRRLIQDLGVPFDFTAHDYYAICPQVNLVSSITELYCREPNLAGCADCIGRRVLCETGDIVSWRWSQKWLITEAERVICPSEDVAQRLRRYGLRNEVVVPHEPVCDCAWPEHVPSLKPGETLRIAVLGILAPHKGASTVASCASAVPPGEITFIVIGEARPQLTLATGVTVTETGLYQEAELLSLINNARPHLIWFPACWPETYSYTLSAAICSGLPIVATNTGAFPERLFGRPRSWLADVESSTDDWLDLFRLVRSTLSAGCLQSGAGSSRGKIKDFYASDYLDSLEKEAVPSSSTESRFDGRTLVLVLPELLEPGLMSPCAYIRLVLPMDRLVRDLPIDFTVVTAENYHNYEGSALICNRFPCRNILEANAIICYCKSRDIKIIYDIDDALFDVGSHHPEASLLEAKCEVVKCFVEKADVVITSTVTLQNMVSQIRSGKTLLIENGIEESLIEKQSVTRGVVGPIRIIYMGTSTHQADFEFVEPALNVLSKKYGDDIEICLLGVTDRDVSGNIRRICPPKSAGKTYPSFIHWLSKRSEWHIGLAPLVDTPFNSAKSAIKAIDYMAIGAVPVVSDVLAYRNLPQTAVVKPRHSVEAWIESISVLIEEPSRRRLYQTAGRYYLHDLYTLSAQQGQRRQIWTRVLGSSN